MKFVGGLAVVALGAVAGGLAGAAVAYAVLADVVARPVMPSDASAAVSPEAVEELVVAPVWRMSRSVSAMTDKPNVIASIDSASVGGAHGSPGVHLVVGCFGGNIYSFFEADSGFSPRLDGTGRYSQFVQLRFDDQPATYVDMEARDDGRQVGYFIDYDKGQKPFMDKLLVAQRVLLETEIGREMRVVQFNPAGLAPLMADIEAACPPR